MGSGVAYVLLSTVAKCGMCSLQNLDYPLIDREGLQGAGLVLKLIIHLARVDELIGVAYHREIGIVGDDYQLSS